MFNKPDMSAFMGKSIAHRGYFDNEAGIPENSLACFQAAIEKGFAIELDIQCFDPRALLWYKKNAPQVARGQLAEKFWEKEEYNGKPLYFVLTYMLTNVATRPDFISYKAIHKDNLSLNICRLLGAKTACYTLKNADELAYVNGDFDMYIFDSFDISQYR